MTRKKDIAKLYREDLSDVKEVSFVEENLNEVAPWFIEILVPEPEKLRDYLKAENIGARLFYPAIHTQKIYQNVVGDFPRALDFAKRGLWLPSANQLDNDQILLVCKKIKAYFKS